MRGLLEALFGADLSGLDDAARWSVEWTGAGDGQDFGFWLAVALLAAVLGVRFLYRRDAPDVSPRVRAAFVALRVVVAALLVAILLEPVLVLERRDAVPSNLLVLVDGSDSMGLADPVAEGPGGDALARELGAADAAELAALSRAERARRALGGGLRADLAADGARRVHVHAFGDRFQLDELGDETSAVDALAPASRGYTAIGTALEQALAAYQGPPLGGVLLVTDGQSNAGAAPRVGAEAAAAAGVVVHVLGLGSDAEARNVTLLRLAHDPVAMVRDPFEVVAHLETHGLAEAGPDEVEVALEVRRGGGPWTERERQAVPLGLATGEAGTGGRFARATFRLTEEEEGELELRARAIDVGGETTLDDNLALGAVRVVRARMKVLLVAGLAFPEVQFLINTLMRDPAYELSSWLQGADPDYEQKGDVVLRSLPRSEEELVAYDCVVLYDPLWSEMPPGFGSWLAELVGREAGGLVYIAGEGETEALFDRATVEAGPVLDLLPVVREAGVFRTQSEKRAIASEPWKLTLTEAGAAHDIFTFVEDPVENAKLCAGLPGLFWHFPVTRAKPGATVLAVHGDPRMQNRYGPHVILASQYFGPGRTTFLACDSTYRWRFVGEELFDGFWARLIGEAGRAKLLGGRTPLIVGSDRATYAPGSLASVTARFRDDVDPAAAPPSLLGSLEVGDAEPREIVFLPSAADPRIYEAQVEVERSGEYLLSVWPSSGPPSDGNLDASDHRFVVESAVVELASPWQDRATLLEVAATAGGRVFDLADRDAIPAAFATGRVELANQERQELWNAPLFFAGAFALLFLEWVLRKRYRLV